MQNIDYTALYEQNKNFKRYVDRYCVKHRISVAEALQLLFQRLPFYFPGIRIRVVKIDKCQNGMSWFA